MPRNMFDVAIRGNMAGYAKAEAKALPRVNTIVVRKAGNRTKTGIKRQISQAFGDAKQFGNAIKLMSDPPRGYHETITVRVFSKARYRGKGTRATDFDLLEIWTRDEDIEAAGHDWMAIPTAEAPWRSGHVGHGGAQRKASPRECGVPLVFLRTGDPNKAVLVTKGAHPIVMYVLMRVVHRGRRLDPDAVHAASLARVQADYVASWAKEDARIAADFGTGVLDLGQG